MDSTKSNIINWLIAAAALYGIFCIYGCGPSIRDRARERDAIWTRHPGTQLEPKGDGVYYITLKTGEILQVIVTDDKISGSSCAKNCGGKPKEQKKQQ